MNDRYPSEWETSFVWVSLLPRLVSPQGNPSLSRSDPCKNYHMYRDTTKPFQHWKLLVVIPFLWRMNILAFQNSLWNFPKQLLIHQSVPIHLLVIGLFLMQPHPLIHTHSLWSTRGKITVPKQWKGLIPNPYRLRLNLQNISLPPFHSRRPCMKWGSYFQMYHAIRTQISTNQTFSCSRKTVHASLLYHKNEKWVQFLWKWIPYLKRKMMRQS